jgi:hypothetical protein
MVDISYLCNKCLKSISMASKTLHEAQCKGNGRVQESNNQLEYKYCSQCDNYVPSNIFQDHKFSHDFQSSDNSMDVSSESMEDLIQSKIIKDRSSTIESTKNNSTI